MSANLKQIEKELDEWLDSDEHLNQCIGYTECQSCCLDKATGLGYGVLGRKKLFEIIERNIK